MTVEIARTAGVRTNERTNERTTNEQSNERTNERTNTLDFFLAEGGGQWMEVGLEVGVVAGEEDAAVRWDNGEAWLVVVVVVW